MGSFFFQGGGDPMEGDLWEGEGKKSPERGAGVSSGAGGTGGGLQPNHANTYSPSRAVPEPT